MLAKVTLSFGFSHKPYPISKWTVQCYLQFLNISRSLVYSLSVVTSIPKWHGSRKKKEIVSTKQHKFNLVGFLNAGACWSQNIGTAVSEGLRGNCIFDFSGFQRPPTSLGLWPLFLLSRSAWLCASDSDSVVTSSLLSPLFCLTLPPLMNLVIALGPPL